MKELGVLLYLMLIRKGAQMNQNIYERAKLTNERMIDE